MAQHTPSQQRNPVAISAPGKVLFAGGFLVLDRQHTGLVFGLDARIHVLVSSSSPPPANADANESAGLRVVVRSPQFGAVWKYDVNAALEGKKGVDVRQLTDHVRGYTEGKNKFVETAVRYAFTYLSHAADTLAFTWESGAGEGKGQKQGQEQITITILADDDYYSSSESTEPKGTNGDVQTNAKKPFKDFGVPLAEAHKTGLGSSAALTTALVGALVAYYTAGGDIGGAEGLESRKKVVHNLAQAAHCAAQGKVGSGFDVAAAVYGSCLYRRFSPAVLEQVGEPDSSGFAERLHRCVEGLELEEGKRWDVEILADRVQVPRGLVLLLCDVDCGSETPGMVRKMLAWRKEQRAESEVLWGGLQVGQEELCEELGRLSRLPLEVQEKEGFERLRVTIETMRSLVREMSAKSGVPVEPEVITELLDHCESVDGVVGGVAPGAGGYDAVALLVKNDQEVMRRLQESLVGWKSKKDGAEIGNVRLLGVKQSQEGVRVEDSGEQRYAMWLR